MSELVSVIVPAYDMAEYLPRAIDSVLTGEYENVEVIVVDDGSTDATPSVIERFTRTESSDHDPRVRAYRQPNRGKSSAVNRGIDMAEGAYLAFLDADDELLPGGLERRVSAVATGDRADVVIGAFETFDGDVVYGRRPSPSTTDPESLHRRFYTRPTTPFHLNACLVSRELAITVDGFDESLDRCVDGDFALAMLAVGPTIRTVDDVVYRYRKHRSSTASRMTYRLKTVRDRVRVMRKHYAGIHRWGGIPFAVAVDLCKLGFEAIRVARESERQER